MPLLRTDTGCRWRKTLVSITTTRLRRSRGAGWRKMLFQTCELRMKSPTDMGVLYTLTKESASLHWPSSFWNLRLLSTTSWPSSPTASAQRSSGLGAGPSKLTPVILKPEPWQGHLNFCSASSQLGVPARWVRVVLSAYITPPVRTLEVDFGR